MFTKLFFITITLFQLKCLLGIIQVNPETNSFIDEQGRERYFHGVNVVVKQWPYHPNINNFDACTSFGQQDIQNLKQWGQNIIRLGVMWAGVEPQKDQFNETYLNIMEEIINSAGAQGIYTLIDFHQDLFSEKYCGDGVPLWMLSEALNDLFPLPFLQNITYNNQTGLPNTCPNLIGGWSTIYATYTVAESFEMLYTNKSNFTERWVNYWRKVATTFKDNPYVIGYELINEPFAGNFYKDPLIMWPGVAERKYLQKVYDLLNNAIREIDDQHIIFFEGVTWDNFFKTGFSHPPGGFQYSNRSALSYHYYSPPDISDGSDIGARMRDIKRLKIGGMLTEFWITSSGQLPAFPTDSINTMNYIDGQKQSWIGWIYKPFYYCSNQSLNNGGIYYGNGTAVENMIYQLSRTFPVAVAGEVDQFSFDVNTGAFLLKFDACISCGDTIIYVGIDQHYNGPNGYKINIEPANSLEFRQISQNYFGFNFTQGVVNGQTITIQITNS